ncbi:MAG: L,D-transpeptidase [Desulfamplus sp.]|nr:L,D-transpeptidase [Desulfamplus sp.]
MILDCTINIRKYFFANIIPLMFYALVWVLPCLVVMVLAEKCVYGDDNVYLFAESGDEPTSFKRTTVTDSVDKNNLADKDGFSELLSPAVNTPTEKNLTEKQLDTSKPVSLDIQESAKVDASKPAILDTQEPSQIYTPEPVKTDQNLQQVDLTVPVEKDAYDKKNGTSEAVRENKTHGTPLNNQTDNQYNQPTRKHQINLLPSALINPPREGASAIVVEKKSQTLWLYTSKKGAFTKVFETPCSTGEADGPKAVEGDKKTPEGIYFLKQIHKERFLTPIYGKRALTTDYPNFLDRTLGKTGSAIWIHGTNKRLKPMDSNGCVAMNNDDVVKLDSYVVLDETPVIIFDRVDYASLETNNAQREALLDFLSKWIDSLNKGSYLEYLFYYSPGYIPDLRWWAEWVDIRSRTAMAGNPVSAQFDHAGIYRHKDHFVVLLDFKVSSHYRTIAVGRRKLFIKQSVTNLPVHLSAEADQTDAQKNVITDNGSKYQGERFPTPTYKNRDFYKIIGDVFQKILIDKSVQDNHFIAAASRLDEQHKVK